ncbi:MAG: S41 family peptidase [Syntrophomonadaceae bacterium]|nr:S41 family peptidase [Syntrophomonadaceae bacterium]
MQKGGKKSLLTAIILALFLMALPAAPAAAAEQGVDYGAYLETMMDYLNQRANEEHSEAQMVEDALLGIFNSLDQFTYFIDTESSEYVTGEFGGIGVSTSMMDGFVVINRVYSETPAEASGVMAGDKVVSVDGVYVAGGEYSHEEITTMMRGTPGTTVNLGVLRQGAEMLDISIVRATIDIIPMSYEIRDDIIHISIEQFNANIGENFRAALQAAGAAGVTKVILDLRNNPGGEVDAMMQVADELIPAGLVFSTEYRYDGYQAEEFYSELEAAKYELVVLVNEQSASCSEIIATAVQDRDCGTVIGTTTFGKYDLQIVTPILSPEASGRFAERTGELLVNATEAMAYGIIPQKSDIIGWLTLNSGWWLRPNGERIGRDGMTPDIMIQNSNASIAPSLANMEPLEKRGKPGLGEESMDVYNAKKILNMAGYEAGNLGMNLDQTTFEAIKAFQADKGMYAYGTLDYSTQDALNALRLELINTLDAQYAKAVEVLQQESAI